jgi:hypothetical protein
VFPRAARAEGPERLPALRPAAPGRRALNGRLVALLLVALVGAVAGCGGDDEPVARPPSDPPDLTVPQTDQIEVPAVPETETVAPAPTPEPEPAPTDTDGGAPAPAPEPPADTPDNDTPPPAESPAERFEDFCNENPGACG